MFFLFYQFEHHEIALLRYLVWILEWASTVKNHQQPVEIEELLALDLSYIHQYPYYYCRTPLMNERIKVLRRAEVINAISDIFYNSEHRIDICGNSRFPSLIFSFESIRGAIMNVKNRKKYTRQRYIFEITQ